MNTKFLASAMVATAAFVVPTIAHAEQNLEENNLKEYSYHGDISFNK